MHYNIVLLPKHFVTWAGLACFFSIRKEKKKPKRSGRKKDNCDIWSCESFLLIGMVELDH